MNIFHLSNDPVISAKAMTNKHIVKMVVELAQLLSTAHWVIDPETPYSGTLYKVTHQNHPSAVWIRQSDSNYLWAYKHFCALCEEYTDRYSKVHKTDQQLRHTLGHYPSGIPQGKQTTFRMAMPDIYQKDDPVQAYRMYYVKEKIKNQIDLDRYMRVLKGDRI